MDSFTEYVESRVTLATDETVRLGPVGMRLVSNVPESPALRFFSRVGHDGEPRFELWCVSLEGGDLDPDYLRAHVDRTYRGDSFLHGYYVTDHFGPPLYLVTRGRRCYVFGEELERVVWPYFVKHFLMRHALEDDSLHLKAAACEVGAAGTLVLGRGGAGKTVFLTQLCLHGARFVTNSHSLVKDGRVTGVASRMRIRPGPWFSDLSGAVEGGQAIKPGEVMIDPVQLFAACADEPVEVKNLCIVDFRGAGCRTINDLAEREAYDYAEQFALALNVYRLEEDLLDLYGGDHRQFVKSYGEMKVQLDDLVRRCRRYYISCDMLQQQNLEEVFTLLST